ncbi:hypothetical protein ON010_g17965 [Phytophthora cinnamomi]|nr:hypothetical protein ON010_g17965 [Phytophthora cinnamomi]
MDIADGIDARLSFANKRIFRKHTSGAIVWEQHRPARDAMFVETNLSRACLTASHTNSAITNGEDAGDMVEEYQQSYMTKEKGGLKRAAAAMHTALTEILKYPSVADDSGTAAETNGRTRQRHAAVQKAARVGVTHEKTVEKFGKLINTEKFKRALELAKLHPESKEAIGMNASLLRLLSLVGGTVPFSPFERAMARPKRCAMRYRYGIALDWITLAPPEHDGLLLHRIAELRKQGSWNDENYTISCTATTDSVRQWCDDWRASHGGKMPRAFEIEVPDAANDYDGFMRAAAKRAIATNIHTHSTTCRKGVRGWHMCSLSRPAGIHEGKTQPFCITLKAASVLGKRQRAVFDVKPVAVDIADGIDARLSFANKMIFRKHTSGAIVWEQHRPARDAMFVETNLSLACLTASHTNSAITNGEDAGDMVEEYQQSI